MHERDLNNTVTPNPKLAIDYCGIKMKNPIIAASGTLDVYKRQLVLVVPLS